MSENTVAQRPLVRRLLILAIASMVALVAYMPVAAANTASNESFQAAQNQTGDVVVASQNNSNVEQGNQGDATATGGDAQYSTAGGAQYGDGGDAAAVISDDDAAVVDQENNVLVSIEQSIAQFLAQFGFFGG